MNYTYCNNKISFRLLNFPLLLLKLYNIKLIEQYQLYQLKCYSIHQDNDLIDELGYKSYNWGWGIKDGELSKLVWLSQFNSTLIL